MNDGGGLGGVFGALGSVVQRDRIAEVGRQVPLSAGPIPDFGVVESEDFVLGFDEENLIFRWTCPSLPVSPRFAAS